MSSTATRIAEPAAILRAWTPFKKILGVTSVRTRAEYARARATLAVLLDEVGEDESHPLAEVLDYLADRIRAYEDQHTTIPEAAPGEVLRLLMEQHGLRQENLADCAPQGRISEILSGKRGISKEVARRLARRFGVSVEVFL